MNDKSNLIIVTDYQILPSITKIKNIAPNKWFDNLCTKTRKQLFLCL